MNKQTGLAGVVICVLGAALLAPSGAAAACTNESLRGAAPSLPGCMALEMVSPPKKFSQPAYLPIFSREGDRVVSVVQTALAETPGYQYFGGDRYVGTRGPGGWEAASTSPQAPAITAGGRRYGGAAAFTADLGSWAQLGSTQSEFQVGAATLFEGSLGGSFSPLSPLLAPVDDSGTKITQQAVEDLKITAAAADLSATVLKVNLASTGYFREDPRSNTTNAPGGDTNSYLTYLDEAGEPALELLARDKDEVVYGGRCGAHSGGPGTSFNQGTIQATFNQGAISPDGERVFLTTRPAQEWDEAELEGPPCNLDNGLRILKRIATPEGPVITEPVPSADSPGDDLFQAASADGTKVYFLSPRKLSGSDVDAASGPCSGNLGASKGCDLYLYEESRPEGEQIVHASAGEGPGAADVLLSATAISGDGSHAYFVAQGVLTADTNTEGEAAVAGQPNLYLYEAPSEELSFLGTLSPDDSAGMWDTKGSGFGDAYAAPFYGPGLQGGGDGHVLAFASKAPLTEDDTDAGSRDVFRYDANTDSLQRVSKAAPGGSETPAADASVNPAWLKVIEYNFGEATRWVSEDGQMIAFVTAEPLLPGDTDNATNPYVWDASELGAAFARITEPPAVAPVGGQIAFSTAAKLLPRDGDVAKDVYVARENGGFAEPVPPDICDPLSEGACEGPPSPKPAAAPPPPTGPSGNVTPRKPAKCKNGQVRRKGKCVKKKTAKGKRRAANSAGRSQRGNR